MSAPGRLTAAVSLPRSTRSVHTRVERSYNDAISLLNTTQGGYRVVQERARTGQVPNGTSIPQMKTWLGQLGYTPADLNALNVIHVTGTKGKGSTSALTSSILNQYRLSGTHDPMHKPRKVGLYTSPHLTSVRERIRLNESPISESLFTSSFFDVWHALGLDAIPAHERPQYFRLLTLLSFHVFLREGVDAAVYEVGIGGEFDATNVFEKIAAAGIVSLGIDHVATLGSTIGEIAWHKAGIVKPGCPAFTVAQDSAEAMSALRKRAGEKGVELAEVGIHPGLESVKVRPAEDFQRKNASLAIQLSATLMKKLGAEVDVDGEILPKEVVKGIEGVNWRGRCEEIQIGKQRWLLDGAHNEQSLEVACNWFSRVSKEKNAPCALVFNQQSLRDAVEMLRRAHANLEKTGTKMKYAVFCTNITNKDSSSMKPDLVNQNVDPDEVKNLTLQNQLAHTWKELDPSTDVVVAGSIEEAVQSIREREGDVQVFVTGSLHLVGGALSVLDGDGSEGAD